ncbi:MAG: Fur family transcriptional regulator [bacterium]
MIKIIPKMEQLQSKLVNAGLRPTFQRLKVLEHIIKHQYDHPTAEAIYESLHKELPVISLATVYNTMNNFHRNGLLLALTITGGEIRYDPNTENHHHFLCWMCGRIYDIDIKCPMALNRKKAIDGHKITEVHGYFKGICRECNKQLKLKRRKK